MFFAILFFLSLNSFLYLSSLFLGSLDSAYCLLLLEGRKIRGWHRMRWLDGITDSTDMSLSKLQQMVKHREAWCAEVHRVAKRWTRLNNNKKHSGGARSQDFQGVRLEEVWSTPSLLQLHIWEHFCVACCLRLSKWGHTEPSHLSPVLKPTSPQGVESQGETMNQQDVGGGAWRWCGGGALPGHS